MQEKEEKKLIKTKKSSSSFDGKHNAYHLKMKINNNYYYTLKSNK